MSMILNGKAKVKHQLNLIHATNLEIKSAIKEKRRARKHTDQLKQEGNIRMLHERLKRQTTKLATLHLKVK